MVDVYFAVEGLEYRATHRCEDSAPIFLLSMVLQERDGKSPPKIGHTLHAHAVVRRISDLQDGVDKYGVAERTLSGVRGLHANKGI